MIFLSFPTSPVRLPMISKSGLENESVTSEHDEPIVIVPMKLGHVHKAAQTTLDAFADSPFYVYLNLSKDRQKTILDQLRLKAMIYFELTVGTQVRFALTVREGSSLIIGSPPSVDDTPLKKFLDYLLSGASNLNKMFLTSQQRKRFDEIVSKTEAIVEREFGDEVKNMFYINLLATEPASQGRGYASAMLEAMIATHGDGKNRATWLNTDSLKNVEFYSSHGFVVVGEFALGDNDPTWDEDPIIGFVLKREVKLTVRIDEKKASEFDL